MNTVLLESKKGVSYISLNRPKSYNALNVEMLNELLDVIKQVEKNDDHVVMIFGEGKAFSAGGDVSMLQHDFADEELYDNVMDTIEDIMRRLYMLPKIVISAVDGPAAGLGMSLALAGDYVVANSKSRLGMLFLGVGLVPDGGGHFWLKERLGTVAAKKFIWSMEQVVASDAEEMGLVDIVSDKPAVERAEQVVKHILVAPIQTMLKTKKIYHEQKLNELKHYLAEEREAQRILRRSENHQEGVKAFIEKRAPVFNNNL
ncbi:Delta(3)-Delta(2)-enoyl-CoA isomerase [Lentibacillus sp. JNUCC-1]|uniref:enoyl-CoA hydratase-related protein n=1 Tax=Lentibacillus sp. JNUCC-1 TaxID=2654513 RepID=UPI0012E7D166|nr:enoyl-CoA hydratase-related protein [Lentibacillus sp. JNUCC-1]MUV36608.1 Delta(3)-Delta(2)-enoyl-CoA isomerase [Lentibacillus sp. JNUCC-1]